MKILTNWQLSCFYPYVPYYANSLEAGIEQKCILPPIPAKVPGSVHKALMDARLLEDPYYDMNSLKAEWIENKWWIYVTSFTLEDVKKTDLVFESIDYKAKIFINDTLCGESENMFVPLVIKAESYLKKGENVIKAVLEGVPEEMAQLGIAELTHTQKSRFGYKWDFGTRIVHIGFPGRVYLKERQPVEAEKVIFHGNKTGKFALDFTFRAEESSEALIKLTVSDNSGKVYYSGSKSLMVENGQKCRIEGEANGVQPWYPNGYGDTPLYKLTLTVNNAQTVEKTVGFADVEARKNEGGEESPFNYLLAVNDTPIYIKGVNVVPLDMLYSDITYERYEKLFSLLKKANINLVRVWGGGRIETEWFYKLADECGIMVWQEFIQSGAGINSKPSEIPEFLVKLEATAREAALKASHVSLVAFSGGNELSDETAPVDLTNKNIALLNSVVQELCPWVLMYPTSPSGGNLSLDINAKGRNFDVHGPWKYYEDWHYTLFNQSDSLLHSEFGCDGLANIDIFNKYISPRNRVVTNMMENYVWRHHGEWWDTYDRDLKIFYKPTTLEEQIAISQFMQAEGIRYAVEANRRRAYNNSGSIIWQANEPFPNVAGTNLIDYFNNPKFAYYKIKQAFAEVNPSLEYDTFINPVGGEFKAKMFITADGEEREYHYRYQIYADNRITEEYGNTVKVGNGRSVFVRELKFKIPECNSVLVKMTVICGEGKYENDVLFPIRVGERAAISPIINYLANY